jgi:hypothetical protein
VPAALVFATAMGALVYKLNQFLLPPEGQQPKYLLAAIAVALICLGLFVLYRGIFALSRAAASGGPAGPGIAQTAERAGSDPEA